MERFQWVNLNKCKCLIQDFSNVKSKDLHTLLDESHAHLNKHRQEKIVVITNIENLTFDRESTRILSDFAKKNKDLVHQSSMYGVSPYHKIAINSVAKLTGRKFNLFETKEQALKWLDEISEE